MQIIKEKKLSMIEIGDVIQELTCVFPYLLILSRIFKKVATKQSIHKNKKNIYECNLMNNYKTSTCINASQGKKKNTANTLETCSMK